MFRTRGAVEHRHVDVGIGDHEVAVGDDDARQVAVPVAVVQPVPQHVHVGDLVADVAHVEREDSPRRTVEQRAHVERARAACAHMAEQIAEAEAGVDEVLDEYHVAPVERHPDVEQQAHAPESGT